MRQWLRKHRKLAIFAGVLAGLWLMNWIFFGISFDFFARQRLESAQAAWESQDIDDYRMVIEFGGGFTLRTQYQITVRDNQVVDAAQKPMVDLIDRQYDPANEPFSPMPAEDASRFTMNNVFSYAHSEVANDTFVHVNTCQRYVVDFDPKLSFVNFYANKCDGSLLGCAIGECEFTYRVIELEPLSPDTE